MELRINQKAYQVYIYALDTLPLFLACITYIPFYPGRYLRPGVAGAHPYAYDARGVLKAHAVPDEELPVGSGDEKSVKKRGCFRRRS